MRQQYFVYRLRGLFDDSGSSMLHRRACARVKKYHHRRNEAGRARTSQALMMEWSWLVGTSHLAAQIVCSRLSRPTIFSITASTRLCAIK